MRARLASQQRALLTCALLLLATGCVSTPDKSASAPNPAKARNGVLASASGKTLYTFDKDAVGSSKSACSGRCVAAWPPMYAAPGAKGGGDWSVITRDDGKPQWAWRGKPLYFWHKDLKAGDRLGDGIDGLWHAAKP